MKRQAQPSIAGNNIDSDIPDSDPVNTDLLWSTVRMATSNTSSDSSTTQTTTDPELAPKRQKRSSDTEASIDDADFETTVLIPRGVEILRGTDAYDFPHTHFKTKKAPESGKKAFYHGLLGGQPMEIFIDGGPDFVQRVVKQYRTFDSWRLNERGWSNLALKYFLEQEIMDMDQKETHQFRTERRDEESIQLDDYNSNWKAPPLLAEDELTKRYSFQISPGAMYWLSLQALGHNWKLSADRYTHHRYRVLCPYLSVDFKEDPHDANAMRKSVNQMACAAVLSLYNRWRLRYDAVKIREDSSWTTPDHEAVRHYGIIMAGVDFQVWIADAKVDKSGQWLGSRVRLLSEGRLTAAGNVRMFVGWVNEIHHWGLGKYAEGVKNDIWALAKKDGREADLKIKTSRGSRRR